MHMHEYMPKDWSEQNKIARHTARRINTYLSRRGPAIDCGAVGKFDEEYFFLFLEKGQQLSSNLGEFESHSSPTVTDRVRTWRACRRPARQVVLSVPEWWRATDRGPSAAPGTQPRAHRRITPTGPLGPSSLLRCDSPAGS